MDPTEHDYLYDAFISYRRSDGATIAGWLRRRLQDYVLPPKIAQGRKNLRVYLDTAFERANEDFWANNIEPALRASRYLVVVATPDASRRRQAGEQNWVEREIELFLSLPQGRHILAVRARGEFAAELPGRLIERFPQITIVDLRAFSPLDRLYLRGPLREHVHTILGTLHDIEPQQMPELRMEDAHNARRAAMRLAIFAIALLVVISGLAITAVIQRNQAREEQSIAEENERTAQHNAAKARSGELALYANASLKDDPERSILLAIQAVNSTSKWKEPPVPAAENALHDAVFYSLARLTLRGHSGHVNAVAFSPDGKRMATGGADNTARIWDTATGRVVLALTGFSGSVNALAFSPDSKRLVTGSQITLSLTKDGRFLTAGSPDETAKVWDAVTGRQIMTLKGSSDRVSAVAFSADGKSIATGNTKQTTRIWDAATGRELVALQGHVTSTSPFFLDDILTVAFSRDGRSVATADPGGTATIWDIASGQERLTVRDQLEPIKSAVFSPDGKKLATAESLTAKLWDASSGKELLALTGHSDVVDTVAFSPNGRFLATGSWDKTGKIWDLDSDQELATLRGHSDFVAAVAFSADSKRLATASWDGTAKVWDVVSGSELVTLLGTSGNLLSKAAFSPDGAHIAATSDNNSAKIWDIVTGKELVPLRGHKKRVTAVAFSPDGKYLATGGADGTAKVWDAASGRKVLTVGRAPGGLLDVRNVSAVAFSPDNKRLATGDPDGTMVWDVASGHELLTLHGHSSFIATIAFTPDGKRLATGSYDKTVKVWDSVSGNELLTLRGHSYGITSLVFAPDGKRLATASADSTAKVWDASSGQELITLRGHSQSVNDLAFSPDGKRLATASADNTVKVWDASNGQELLTLHSYLWGLSGVGFSPDGRRLVAFSSNELQIFTMDIHELLDLAHKRVGRKPPGFSAEECTRYFPSETCPVQP